MSVIIGNHPKLGHIEYYQNHNGLWYWRYRASNGRIQFDGAEAYVSSGNVIRAIKGLQKRGVLNFYLKVIQA